MRGEGRGEGGVEGGGGMGGPGSAAKRPIQLVVNMHNMMTVVCFIVN